MSKNQPKIQERTCRICYHTYNMVEYETCPQCEAMHELSKEFLHTTDDDTDVAEHYNI